MPCRDDGQLASEYGNLQRRLDEVTQMLCGVLGAIEEAEEPVRIDHLAIETQEWWNKHKKADEQRRSVEERAKEARRLARERALAKLTPEERRALGL